MTRHIILLLAAAIVLSACQTGDQGPIETVLIDFGLREKPEGYVSTQERAYENLREVGRTEIKRLNIEHRQGEVHYQVQDEFQGRFYREVKAYEDFYPLEVKPFSGSSQDDSRSYAGFIAFTYRIRQSARVGSRTEAASEPATIETDQTGQEVYRYRLDSAGYWDGNEGKRVKN